MTDDADERDNVTDINETLRRKFPGATGKKPRVGNTEPASSRIFWMAVGTLVGVVGWKLVERYWPTKTIVVMPNGQQVTGQKSVLLPPGDE